MHDLQLPTNELIDKYNISGPRYTSYPTAIQFEQDFDFLEVQNKWQSADRDKPLSLYVHIPFCKNICYYCACNKVITKDTSKADEYLTALIKEAKMLRKLCGERTVTQLHWGGGTPTFLSNKQISYLFYNLQSIFDFDLKHGEFSIEIDPRGVDKDTLQTLKYLGFNRLSIGVQDLNTKVQQAVNRVHSTEQITQLMQEAVAVGFDAISLDLIYGLPHQTVESFSETLDGIIKLKPNRLSVFNYAHLPHRFKQQRGINDADLPPATEKLNIFKHTLEKLCANGYEYIGMDHFALPDDSLSLAQEAGELHRNFQGYTTQPDCDLVALGVSAISQVQGAYSQNQVKLEDYYAALANNELPVWRGCLSTEDDFIRRAVIMNLICNFSCTYTTVEQKFDIEFTRYFAEELSYLEQFYDDQLIEFETDQLMVTPLGRFFIRNICMIFDLYLKEISQIQSFSKVI
jgi:oxygen-independent coproporphyrinogen III oxidase